MRGEKMSGIVQSVGRALTILELVSEYNRGVSITEICNRVDLHKSTVHRLLGTLILKGFVIQDSDNKYGITLKLFELGSKRIEGLDILTVSKPYTKALMETINEVVHLVIRDVSDIVYIDKVEADNTIRMASTIGQRRPLYCTAVGKSILAFLPDDEAKLLWDNSNIKKLTKNTIINYNNFSKELEKIRNQGFAEDNEENEIGIRCISAPIFNRNSKIEGAISISGPAMRVTKDKTEEFAKEVKKYAYLISKDLGYKEHGL